MEIHSLNILLNSVTLCTSVQEQWFLNKDDIEDWFSVVSFVQVTTTSPKAFSKLLDKSGVSLCDACGHYDMCLLKAASADTSVKLIRN